MADKKISALDAIVAIDDADVLPIVDASVSTTKKINVSQVKALAPVQSVASKTGAVTLVKGDVGLGNVDNTADADKPISTATQTALNAKQDTLVSGTNIKTINDQSILGSGNITISGGGGISDGDKGDITVSASGATWTIDNGVVTNAKIASGVDAAKIADGTVSNAEFQYLGGVTSDIQTQVDAKTAKLITTNRQTASYTLVLSDADKLVEMNVGSANNLTVPLNSSVAFPTGTQILLAQYGAGQTTVVATSGVTIRSNGGKLKLNVQYSGATLIKIGTDEWYLFGDIVA